MHVGETLSMLAAKPPIQAEWTARWMFAPRWALTPPSSYLRGEPSLAASRILKRGPRHHFWFRAYSIPAISCSKAVFFFFFSFSLLEFFLLQHLLLRRNWKWMIKSLATPPCSPLLRGQGAFQPDNLFSTGPTGGGGGGVV